MSNRQVIKEFLFDFAQYHIRDARGNDASLQINYKENTFSVKTSKKLSKKFLNEINIIATNLLKKKHGVNRVGFL